VVASSSRTMIAGSLSSLYEGLACQEVFAINISSFPFREARASAVLHLMARQASLLGRAERSPPRARRVAPEGARVDGESARRATMVSCHYAANVTALYVLVDPLFSR
jgi:hypothetical protein